MYPTSAWRIRLFHAARYLSDPAIICHLSIRRMGRSRARCGATVAGVRRKSRKNGRRRAAGVRRQRGGWAPANVGGWRSQAAGPVGCGWVGGEAGTWPGVFGAAGGNTHGATVSNYYPLSKNGVGPSYPGASTRNKRFTGFKTQGGGRRRRRRRTRRRRNAGGRRPKRGGGLRPLFPQAIANTFWQAGAAMKGLGASLAGKVFPISAYPSVLRQPIDQNYTYLGTAPVDIEKIHLAAGDSVSRM